MTAAIIPFPSRKGTAPAPMPPARLDHEAGSSAVLDVLRERLAILECADRTTLPVPAGARARAVRWAADMIIQIELLDAAERNAR